MEQCSCIDEDCLQQGCNIIMFQHCDGRFVQCREILALALGLGGNGFMRGSIVQNAMQQTLIACPKRRNGDFNIANSA